MFFNNYSLVYNSAFQLLLNFPFLDSLGNVLQFSLELIHTYKSQHIIFLSFSSQEMELITTISHPPFYSLSRQLKFKCLFCLSLPLSFWLTGCFSFLLLNPFSSLSHTPEIWESIRQRICKVIAICLTHSPPPPSKTQPIPGFTMSSFSPIGNRKKVI